MARAKAQPAQSDPLIAALIAKLPPSGTWPVDRQKAWLKLMALALSAIYGGDVGAEMEADTVAAAAPTPVASNGHAHNGAVAAQVPSKPAAPSYAFFIDRDGYAKRRDGRRIMPEEIGDILYDLRGESGDPRGVIWADDSVGDGGPNIAVSVVM